MLTEPSVASLNCRDSELPIITGLLMVNAEAAVTCVADQRRRQNVEISLADP
jgi:hypothetical protein